LYSYFYTRLYLILSISLISFITLKSKSSSKKSNELKNPLYRVLVEGYKRRERGAIDES